MVNINGISFSERVAGGIASIVANGIAVPSNRKFDPLAKIWSTLRRRILEQYKVDIVGIFASDDERELISANFYLNYAVEGEFGEQTYTGMFEDSFPKWAELFEQTLLAFLESETYDKYIELLGSGTTEYEPYRKLFNSWLRGQGLRTKKDDRRSAAKEKSA